MENKIKLIKPELSMKKYNIFYIKNKYLLKKIFYS